MPTLSRDNHARPPPRRSPRSNRRDGRGAGLGAAPEDWAFSVSEGEPVLVGRVRGHLFLGGRAPDADGTAVPRNVRTSLSTPKPVGSAPGAAGAGWAGAIRGSGEPCSKLIEKACGSSRHGALAEKCRCCNEALCMIDEEPRERGLRGMRGTRREGGRKGHGGNSVFVATAFDADQVAPLSFPFLVGTRIEARSRQGDRASTPAPSIPLPAAAPHLAKGDVPSSTRVENRRNP